MVIGNFPTFGYITYQGLIIISADETPYVISDGNTDCKYVYWETSNPYTLKATNEKLSTSTSRYLIYFNENGVPTEAPQDTIKIQYREGSGVLISKISGQVSELDGKYYAIKEDINGIQKIIGSSEETEDGTIIDKINKIEQTANGTSETIKKLETKYNENQEAERIRDGISEALIAMATALGEYQEIVSSACEDFKITSEEKIKIQEIQDKFINKTNLAFAYHDTLIEKISSEQNKETINQLNHAKSNLQMAVNNLNTNVNTSISDNSVVPSEITIMLNMFGNIGVKANEYKEILSEAIILGTGGEIVSNIFSTTKTATEFNQRIASITEVIDPETGLPALIEKNETNINQTAENIRLNYVKFDKVTSEITVADEVIKLDAGTVLMTGTLTWDSLDDEAKANLKGDKGENGSAEYVMLTGDQFIKYNAQGTPNRSSVLITALISGITDIPSIIWKYKNEGSGDWIALSSNEGKTYYSLGESSSIWNGKDSITIRAIVNNLYYDDLTVVKVRDGVDGTLAEYVEINGDNIFKYTIKKGTTEFTPTPKTITLEGKAYNITNTNTKWYYKRPTETSWTIMSSCNGLTKITISPDDTTLFPNENDVVQIKFELNTHFDIVTITRLFDGQDSVMAVLTNESHTIPCSSNGEPTTYTGASTDLIIYVGSINDTNNWTSSVTTQGVVGKLSNNNKTFTVTELVDDIGYVDFVALKDNFDSIEKRFTVIKSKNGKDGHTGDDSTSYWIVSSASAIIRKQDETYNPSTITFNAKRKEGKKDVTDCVGFFRIYEKVDGSWTQKYKSSSAESDCSYKIVNPNEIKVELYDEEDKAIIDEEQIPMLLDGESTPVAYLDNDSHVIPCNFSGTPLNYDGAVTTMYVYLGSIDNSDTWNYTFKENNVKGIVTNKRTYMVTEILDNNAYVDITASKQGYESITRRFALSKVINGTDGESAKYVVVTGDQVFKYAENFTGTPTPTSITLTATKNNITELGKWQYKKDEEYIDISGATSETITITPSSGTFSEKNISTFRYIAEGYYDEITIIKISDGSNGLPGSPGEDSIYIILSNENHSVPCDSEGNYTDADLEKAVTEVFVYKGVEEIPFTISSVSSEGCTGYIDGNKVGITNLTENSAKVTISIRVENQVFTKVMSISKALQGGAGSGINVLGVLGSVDDLPSTGSPNDAYLINGEMYVWSPTQNKWVKGATVGAIKGDKGADGRTTYFHIKYSNDGKTFTPKTDSLAEGEAIGDWIGFCTDFSEEDPTTFSAYKWKKIKGEQGDNGIVANLTNDSHVVPCKSDGTGGNFSGCSTKISLFLGAEELDDGVTYSYKVSDEKIYVEWYKETGTCKVTSMNGIDTGVVTLTAYFNNVAYSKDFSISKSKQGSDAYTINLSNENHSFLADSEGKITIAQSTETTVSVFKGTTLVDFTIDGDSLPSIDGLKIVVEGKKVKFYTDNSKQLAEEGTISIPIIVNSVPMYKQFSFTRVDSGKDGKDGLDAYTVILTNETHSFVSNSEGEIEQDQATITTVKTFYGAKEIEPKIGTISKVKGLTITKNGATISITTNKNETLAESGSFNIPITVNNIEFIKVFSWTKIAKGSNGLDGLSAKYVIISGEQIFKYAKGNSTPSPTQILLSASRFNTTEIGKWQYKNASGTWVDLGVNTDILTVKPTTGTLKDSSSCTFRYIVEDVSDEITVVEVSDGIDGNSGQTFYTWIMYADDNKGTNISNSPTNKKYIGLSYNNTTSTESTDPTKYKWSLIKGTDGIPGEKGADGVTYYTWIKYSDSSDGSNMYDTPNKDTKYIGIAVNKTTKTESTNKSDYSWSQFRGDNGTPGKDAYTVILTNEAHSFICESNGNIPNETSTSCQVLAYKGTDSVTPTIGTLPSVTGLTLTKNGTAITVKANAGTSLANSGSFNIPITVDNIKFTKTFSWSKTFKGLEAKYIVVSGEQVFKYAKNSSTPSPSSITLTATKYNTTETGKWQYKNASGTWIDMNVTALTLSVTPTSGTLSSKNSCTFRYLVGSIYDEITIAKLVDGKDGNDAYTVVLSNESHVFGCENNGNIPSVLTTTCKVIAYKGTSTITPTIGTLPTVSGLTLSKSGATITIKANAGTSLANNGSFNIPITVDGKSFTKTFSWSKSFKGLDANYVIVSGEQTFKYAKNSTTPTPSSITLTASRFNTTATGKWQYKNASGTWVDMNVTALTLSVTPTSGTLSSKNACSFRYIIGSIYDEITVVKLVDGEDAHTIVLSNESHIFSCESNGNIPSVLTTTCQVIAYKGSTLVTPTIGSLPSVTGLTLTKSGTTITIKANTGTSLANSGTFNIPITVDGKNFTKTFSWTKAYKGVDARHVVVNGEQAFKYASGSSTPSPSSITLTATKYNTTETGKWQYKNASGTWVDMNVTALTLSVTPTSGTLSSKGSCTFRYIINDIYDEITVAKLVDGKNGNDAYTVILSNECHSFPCQSNGNIPSEITVSVQVIAYKGTSAITPTIGTLPTVSGLTLSKSGAWFSVKANTGTSLANSGTFNIPITVDGKSFTKTFSWTKTFKGVDANYVIVSGEQAFKYASGSSTPTPSSITLTATRYNTTASGKWQYKNTSGTWTDLGVTSLSATITPTSGTLSSKGSCTFRYLIGSIYDEITVAKLVDGKNGNDAYTVILSNECHSFLAESDGKIPSEVSTTCKVTAYKGTSTITPTIGTLPTVSGLTLSKSGTTITIKAKAGTSLATSGSFNISITVDGLTFTKAFSWVKVLKGKNGTDASVPSWISDWDGNKTTINDTTVLAPKIFAGSVSNGVPTGVALGKNVFGTSGTYSNISGIAGYKSGTKTYHFKTDGSMLLGSTDGYYISWDGTNLKMNVSSFTISSSSVAKQSSLDSLSKTVGTVSSTVSQTSNKLSWVIKSGTTESSMTLTDKMYSLISENVTIKASKIKLEGYISANNNFKIDTSGNMSCSNATIKGTITSSTLSSNTINGGTITGTTINNGSGTFKVTNAGVLTCTSATISGKITATSGKIAGFTISGNDLKGSKVGMGGASSSTNQAFWAGSNTASSAPFRVGHDGTLYSSKGTFAGKVETSSIIYANGGLYTKQDIRGLDTTEGSGGLTLVTGTGNIAIRTESSNYTVYLQSYGEVKITKPKQPSTYTDLRLNKLVAHSTIYSHADVRGAEVYANGVKLTSDRDKKRDIENYTEDALYEICTTPVRTYHLDCDLDEEIKRIGIILQEAPLNAVDIRGEGVDLYQMVAMSWKAIQQLKEENDTLKKEIENLKGE